MRERLCACVCVCGTRKLNSAAGTEAVKQNDEIAEEKRKAERALQEYSKRERDWEAREAEALRNGERIAAQQNTNERRFQIEKELRDEDEERSRRKHRRDAVAKKRRERERITDREDAMKEQRALELALQQAKERAEAEAHATAKLVEEAQAQAQEQAEAQALAEAQAQAQFQVRAQLQQRVMQAKRLHEPSQFVPAQRADALPTLPSDRKPIEMSRVESNHARCVFHSHQTSANGETKERRCSVHFGRL